MLKFIQKANWPLWSYWAKFIVMMFRNPEKSFIARISKVWTKGEKHLKKHYRISCTSCCQTWKKNVWWVSAWIVYAWSILSGLVGVAAAGHKYIPHVYAEKEEEIDDELTVCRTQFPALRVSNSTAYSSSFSTRGDSQMYARLSTIRGYETWC